jgi:hypothetical protein
MNLRCLAKDLSTVPYHGPGRERTVKLISTGGATQLCNIGQPPSALELRQTDAVALLISDGSTAPFSGARLLRTAARVHRNSAGPASWHSLRLPPKLCRPETESRENACVLRSSSSFTSFPSHFTHSVPLAAVLSKSVFGVKNVRAEGAAVAGSCRVNRINPSPSACLAITATSLEPAWMPRARAPLPHVAIMDTAKGRTPLAMQAKGQRKYLGCLRCVKHWSAW